MKWMEWFNEVKQEEGLAWTDYQNLDCKDLRTSFSLLHSNFYKFVKFVEINKSFASTGWNLAMFGTENNLR